MQMQPRLSALVAKAVFSLLSFIQDFGYDPLGLGANPERLTWFKESERVHCRWGEKLC